MNFEKIQEIIAILETAIAYNNMELVQDAITELSLLEDSDFDLMDDDLDGGY